MDDRAVLEDELSNLEDRIAHLEMAVSRCRIRAVYAPQDRAAPLLWEQAARYYQDASGALRERRESILHRHYPG